MEKKAQIAYEFIILFFFLSLLFTLFTAIATDIRGNIQEERERLHVEDLAQKIQQDFYTAIQMPQGYERTIRLPASILNKEYNASIVAGPKGHYLYLATTPTIYTTKKLPPLTLEQETYKLPITYNLTKEATNVTIKS